MVELEQLGSGTKKGSASTATSGGATTTPAATTTAAAPSLKRVQPTGDGGGGGEGKQKGGAPAQKRPCQLFGTDQGCKNGKQCTFAHSWTGLNRGERCLLCGSKQRRTKHCGTNDAASPERPSPPPPPRNPTTAATSSTTTPALRLLWRRHLPPLLRLLPRPLLRTSPVCLVEMAIRLMRTR